MRLLGALASGLAFCLGQVVAQHVSAHFMVGNTALFGVDDWRREISLAKAAGIDSFALNMANNEATTTYSVPLAFDAADALGFKLFFSFDYAGNGPWPKNTVVSMINKYKARPSYLFRASQPLVSTFEGPEKGSEWAGSSGIKALTNCFFIPDWSSIGARPAMATGIPDGLFSWDAWPKGPANSTTYPDASYHEFLNGKPYMMPVSPWFYTNMPGFDKNWVWNGDNLWFHRWQQILSLDFRPEYLQIISWNDYGESHYIGPLDDRQYEAFGRGRSPYNYVQGMPHDGWREFLPYIIALWKTGTASITQEGLVSHYRRHPHGACSDGDTTGNTANQLQFEHRPASVLRDRVFYTALLTSPAQVTVTIGGVTQQGGWDQVPHGGVGLYYGSVPMNGATGGVTVVVRRGGATIATVDNGPIVTTNCPTGLSNYNPWVGSARGPAIGAVSPPMTLDTLSCVEGFGALDFLEICKFTCRNGYCPSTACVCLKKGVPNPPNITNTPGYPLPGKSASFAGLCSFACNHGFCPPTICGLTPNTGVIPTTSPFLPPACTAGNGPAGAFMGLCDFSCHFGFCPINICRCTATGVLIDAPPKVNTKGYFLDKSVNDAGLCNFACSHGWCPDVCGNSTAGTGAKIKTITLDAAIWGAPTAVCPPPCLLVLPPSTLAAPTTIVVPPYRTSLEFGWITTKAVGGSVTTVYTSITITTTITVPPITTSIISFSNVLVTTTTLIPSIIFGQPSISPPPFVITLAPPASVTASPVPRIIRPPPWPFGQAPPEGEDDDDDDDDEILPPVPWVPDLPVFTTLPTKTLSWHTRFIPEPTTTTDSQGTPVPIIPCWVWFIWFCPPNIGGLILWDFVLPGIYPVGGPPPLPPWPGPGPPPPKIPWPEITIGKNHLPTYAEPEQGRCTKATATIITTTTSYGVSVVANQRRALETRVPFAEHYHVADKRQAGRSTTTYTTRTETFSTRVTGCGASDITKTTSVTATAAATANPHIIIPRDPKASANTNINAMLASQNINNAYESRTNALGTIFFFVPAYTDAQAQQMRGVGEVFEVYVPRGRLTAGYYPAQGGDLFSDSGRTESPGSTSPQNATGTAEKRKRAGSDQSTPRSASSPLLSKRAAAKQSKAEVELALLSWGPSKGLLPLSEKQDYEYDDSAGVGTFLYNLDYGILPSHPEFSDLTIEYLYPQPNAVSRPMENDAKRHGTPCMSKAVGKTLGVARRATLVQTVIDYEKYIMESLLDGLLKIHEDIRAKPGQRGSKAVLNLSVSTKAGSVEQGWVRMCAYLLKEIIKLGVTVVTGSGNVKIRVNAEQAPYGWPAKFGDPGSADYMPELIVVGSCTPNGMKEWNGAVAPWVTVFAPGRNIRVARNDVSIVVGATMPEYSDSHGTSEASATVAGLAAYYRGLFPFLDTGAKVKSQIVSSAFQRPGSTEIKDAFGGIRYRPDSFQRDVVWNGFLGTGGTCSAPSVTRRDTDTTDGSSTRSELEPQVRGVHGVARRQASGGTCAVPPRASPIVLRPEGTPGPVCASSSGAGCGKRCLGFFCEDTKLPFNPDRLDPRNPDSVQNPESPSFGDWDGPEPVDPIPSGQTSIRLVLAYDMGPPLPSTTVLWWWMPGRTNGVEINMCDVSQLRVTSGGGNLDPANPPTPPSYLSGPFQDELTQYGGCSYVAPSGSGGGSLNCKHTGVFACARDNSPYIQCNQNSHWGEMKMRPVVRCDFPAIG